MPNILVIDNYDSFTWNLVQELGELGATLDVRRNDAVTVADIAALAPDGIVLSPGPGRPEDAGVTMEVIRTLGGQVPLLGVCLGHQAIGAVFGAAIVRAPSIMHGKVSAITHRGEGVFAGLASPLIATRYHSLVIDPSTLPDELAITAECDGIIMGIHHRTRNIEGVQFHPESVLTPDGMAMLGTFLERCR